MQKFSSGAQSSDTNYWSDYYKKDLAPKPPSDFAQFALKYMSPSKKLIDLGCGNGRDSMFFARGNLKVTAVDLSEEALARIDQSLPIFTVCDDFVSSKILLCIDYDYFYSRWSLHAINQIKQDELLPKIYSAMHDGGHFFIEARTINDTIFGKGKQLGKNEFFYENHYRRFINPEQLISALTSIGFKIVFSKESNQFSVMGTDAPTLIRIVAKK